MNILEQIVQKTYARVAEEKNLVCYEKIKQKAYAMPRNESFPFEEALKKPDISFICEIKKASPSKGVICEKFVPLEVAKDYQRAGADAISILTEPYYFQGNNEYLKEISKEVDVPLLRKDFIVDDYMIYEAKVLGASAILLIVAILDQEILKEWIELAHELGLSVLVEAHTEEEVRTALEAGARVIGVNNRDLKTFKVDLSISEKLRRIVSKEVLFVSESGMSTSEDINRLRDSQVDGVLVGESLMRISDKTLALDNLRGVRYDQD